MIAPPAVIALFLFIFAIISYGDSACTKTLILETTSPEDKSQEVFVKEEDANRFLGRHLLFNRFDFEIFTPGNLERECYEEVCNYEEAREVFENDQLTKEFWKKYTEDKEKPPQLDVTSLLVGLIAAGVAIVIIGLLLWYFCQDKWKDDLSRASSRVRRRRSNASVILRRLEEVSLQPIPPPPIEEIDSPGLPTYEQAVAKCGPHDAPPPPYPGSRHGSIRR